MRRFLFFMEIFIIIVLAVFAIVFGRIHKIRNNIKEENIVSNEVLDIEK